MPSIKTVAAKNISIRGSATKPTGPTVTAFTTSTDFSCLLAANGTSLSATGSDKITDPSFCEGVNSGAFANSNYEGAIVPFVMLDSTTGAYNIADNAAFEMFKVKNTIAYLWVREGVPSTTTAAAGQLVSCYEVRSDTPQRQSDLNGYIKRTIPLDVTPLFENVALAAS